MGRAPLSGTTHSPWLPLHAHPRAASQGWNLQDRVAGGLVSRIQAALGFGSSRRSGREACATLQPSLDVLPSVTSGTNRFLPWGPWGGTSWGCCILATFIASFLPHGPEASAAPPRGPGPRVPSCPGRQQTGGSSLGHGHGAPLGLLPPVCLRLLLIFQAKVCCWFLSPLVPTLHGTYLLTMMGEAVGKLSGRKLVVPGDGTGIYPTAPFFLPRMHKLSCLIYFFFR